mgnify:CR=1 FL=1
MENEKTPESQPAPADAPAVSQPPRVDVRMDLPGDAPVAPPPVSYPAPHAAGQLPVGWEWPSVHPEAWKFAPVVGALALVFFFSGWSLIAWPLVALTIFICAFFRDPKRASPAGEGLILSPADGLVSQIMTVEVPRQLIGEGALSAGTATRISVFMSVFDVHINRAPIAGTVTKMAYVPGAFLNADLDKASEENERQYFLIEGADGTKVGFTQIAGLIARRIVGFVRDLPHELVAAFRSTLSEAREADLLLHVVDADDPLRDERMAQVDEVLAEIGAGDIPQLLVFNKIDRIEGAEPRIDHRGDDRIAVWISARDGVGLDLMRDALGQRLGLRRVIGEITLPTDAGRLRARLHALDAVRGERHEADGWHIAIDLPVADAARLAAQADGAPLRPLLPVADPELPVELPA